MLGEVLEPFRYLCACLAILKKLNNVSWCRILCACHAMKAMLELLRLLS